MTCVCPKPVVRIRNVRVTLLRYDASATENTHGEQARNTRANWTDLGDRWANWKTKSGSERFASEQTQAGHSHRVYMLRDNVTKTLTPEDRLGMPNSDRWFGIDAVSDEDEQHRWMVLDITESK